MDENQQIRMAMQGKPATQASIFRLTAARFAALAVAAIMLAIGFGADSSLTLFFLHRQDLWLLLAAVVVLAICTLRLHGSATELSGTWRFAMLVGSVMALIAFAGHYWVLSGYDMSRDEQMATFDANVFASGHLVASVPAFWRDHADALNTMFMYPAEHRGAWVSNYLPLNAALRAIVGLAATQALTGPLLNLLGALALWGCARRIWPQDRETPVVALLLYFGSAQILVNGMTSYAMPAHLALNLVWLWLFLRKMWWSDTAALAVGFVAVGLHQPIMHPMFAAPILFLLLLDKEWRRAGVYLVGYAVIGVFWLWWPNWTWALSQASAAGQQPDGVDYLTRLMLAVTNGSAMGVPYMMANILRFFAWQHLLLLPLLILGVRIVRSDRLAGALLAGIVLTICVMTVILPYQGHGFGYRYVHGLIGSAILLAVYGWKSLGRKTPQWRSLLRRTTVAGLAVLLPMQVWMAHQFYAPFAQASALMDQIDADYVVVGGNDVPFTADLVINPPDLDRRPVRLIRGGIDTSLERSLCAKQSSIALVGDGLFKPISAYFEMARSSSEHEENQALAKSLQMAGCLVTVLD